MVLSKNLMTTTQRKMDATVSVVTSFPTIQQVKVKTIVPGKHMSKPDNRKRECVTVIAQTSYGSMLKGLFTC